MRVPPTALAIALAALLGLTGCGAASGGEDEDGEPAPADAVAKTAERSSQVRGYRASSRTHLESVPGRDDYDVRFVVSARQHPDVAFDLTFDERVEGRSPRDTVIRIKLLGGRTYQKIDTSHPGHGAASGRWHVADPPGAATTPDTDAMGGLDGYRLWDPMLLVRLLPGSADVRRVGTERVDGVPTTRYAGGLDMARALPRLDRDTQIMAAMLGIHRRTLSYQLWVDDGYLPRRLVLTTVTARGSLRITGTAGSFDEPVTIHPPPARTLTGR